MNPALMALAPSAIDNLYHVGYLVPDLRVGMHTFGRPLRSAPSGATRPT